MLQTVEGIYRNGKVEVLEAPSKIMESRVIITFLDENGQKNVPEGEIKLEELGITRQDAAELRASFETFAEDWELPEMDIYDRM